MSKDRFRYLFNHFINKTGTEEEIEEFLLMIKKNLYDEEIKDLLSDLWNKESYDSIIDERKADQLFRKIMASRQVRIQNLFHNRSLWYKSIAAILIIGLSSLFYWYELDRTEPQLTQSNAPVIKAEKNPIRRFINLPDGSSVILNENSRVELSKNFGSNGLREVYLYGEAYFDVTHDLKKPFIVYTGKVKTTVLGTAFNIKESSLSQTVTVTVTRGKVKSISNAKLTE